MYRKLKGEARGYPRRLLNNLGLVLFVGLTVNRWRRWTGRRCRLLLCGEIVKTAEGGERATLLGLGYYHLHHDRQRTWLPQGTGPALDRQRPSPQMVRSTIPEL
jgi:hypothetical protein